MSHQVMKNSTQPCGLQAHLNTCAKWKYIMEVDKSSGKTKFVTYPERQMINTNT